jgi:hypothetical protein
MSATIQLSEIVPGVLVQQGVRFSKGAAETFLLPLVGKKIKSILIQEDQGGSNEPEIILEFEDGSAAAIMADAEGNGPGFIEFIPIAE